MSGAASKAILLIGLAALFLSPARAQVPIDPAGARATKHIRSLKEIRDANVVHQRWDLSCGAAALSTLLTYDFKDDTPETAIVVWLLHRTDPARVRSRGGFSLFDLKRFAQARGYRGEGFSGMSLDDLAALKTSAITPIRVKGYDHFVVVRGVAGDRVFLADPGFGNLVVTSERFSRMWKQGIVFIVHPPDPKMVLAGSELPLSAGPADHSIVYRILQQTAPNTPLQVP
jgi:predicted double-glycine peptidase